MANNLYRWPQGHQCAVMLSILYDDGRDALAIAPDLAQRSKSRSVWEYGSTRGVERLVDVLKQRSLPATWFSPATVIEEQRALFDYLLKQGHDIASRGIDFENYGQLTPPQQQEMLQRGRDIIANAIDHLPRGFRLPCGLWPNAFEQQLVQAGYNWSSTLNGDDFPYRHFQQNLIELPVHIELEDRPYFQFNFTPAFPVGHSRIAGYDAVLNNWKDEFDAYRQYKGCFILQLRPEIIGTPGRIFIVEQLLDYICQFDDVWFATGSQIADWHLAYAPELMGDHPMHVYQQYQRELQS